MNQKQAVYGRISGTDDPRTASLETQVQSVRDKLGNIPDTDVFLDKFTGTMLHDRPSLSQLREQVRAGKYSTIGIHCLDRLSRDPTHLAVIFDECERYGCQIVSATEVIEDTPEGVLMRNVRGYVAQIERIKILERTQRGTRRLLEQNLIPGSGKARFGYRYENRQRVIHPGEAEVVKQVFQWAAEGVSIRQICIRLNGAKVPAPRESAGGRPGSHGWAKAVLGRILRDASYYGRPMLWGKTKTVGRKLNGRAQVEAVPVSNHRPLGPPTPAIVDQVVWHLAQTAIDKLRSYYSCTSARRKWRMLSGMIKCRCGCTMTTQKTKKYGGGHYLWYCCTSKPKCDNPRMQIPLVEQQVWSQVVNLTRDESALKRAIDRRRGRRRPWFLS